MTRLPLRLVATAAVLAAPLLACGGNPPVAGSNATPRAGTPTLTGCYRLTRAGGEPVAGTDRPSMLALDTIDAADRPDGLPRGDARRARLLTAKRRTAGEAVWVRSGETIVLVGPAALLGAERVELRIAGGRISSAAGTPAFAGYRVPCPAGAGG
jgi:hypothetical protein